VVAMVKSRCNIIITTNSLASNSEYNNESWRY